MVYGIQKKTVPLQKPMFPSRRFSMKTLVRTHRPQCIFERVLTTELLAISSLQPEAQFLQVKETF